MHGTVDAQALLVAADEDGGGRVGQRQDQERASPYSLMTLGLFLLARLTPESVLVDAAGDVAIAGAGMGILFAVVGVVALNAAPPTQMGAGAAAVRYLGQIGGMVGVTLVATAVNASLAGALGHGLPRTAIRRLASESVTVTANPQVLANPAYRARVTRQAAATAHLPQQAQHLVAQVFDALRLARTEALHRGFLVTLTVAGVAVLAAALLVDRPMDRTARAPPVYLPPPRQGRIMTVRVTSVRGGRHAGIGLVVVGRSAEHGGRH